MKKSELEQLVKTQAETIEAMKKELEAVKTKGAIGIPEAAPLGVKAEVASSTVLGIPQHIGQGYLVPTDFRETVDAVLNKEFGVEVTTFTDRPAFEFAIIVPKKYSNAPEPYWQTYKMDRRPKVIDNATGLNGVKEWVKKVFDNLGQDARMMIALDRQKLGV